MTTPKDIISSFKPRLTSHSKNGVNFQSLRFDEFKPLDSKEYVGGLKSLQCCNLILNNYDKIISLHNGVVSTCSDLNSPQANVIAGAAKLFGLKSIVGVCGDNSKPIENLLAKHKMMKSAQRLGAEITPVTKAAYQSVIESRLQKHCKETNQNPFFVKFGINVDNDREAIINSSANHMSLLPENIDILVVPVGSGLALSGVFAGLHKYKIRPKRIIGIQVSGGDRKKKIGGWMPTFVKYNWEYHHINSKYNIAYKEYVNFTTDDGHQVDVNYEGKAFSYFFNNLDDFNVKSTDKVVVLEIGNTNEVRRQLSSIEYVDFESKRIK